MVLRYLGVLLESYIDISYILTRSEFLGMPHLPVTNLVTNLLQNLLQSLLHHVLPNRGPLQTKPLVNFVK